MGVITLITTLTLPSISSYFRISIKSTTRELATVIREAYNSTMITGFVHRLVLDFKKNQYWVERGPESYLLHTKESLEKEESRLKWFGETKEKSAFALYTSITKNRVSFPGEIRVKDVYTEQKEDPITEGQAYIHFFPNGFTEQSIIHLEDDSKHEVSLVISALIGKTKVYGNYVSKEEAFDVN